MFDTLCPIRSNMATHIPLCVILVIENSLNIRVFDPKVAFRKFIQEYSHYSNRVSFMYVYSDYQPMFVLPIEGTLHFLSFGHQILHSHSCISLF